MNPESRRRFLQSSLAMTILAVRPNALVASPSTSRSTNPTASDEEKFLKAIVAGDEATVSAMLAANQRLAGIRNDHGRSAFAIAILSGFPSLAGKLAEAGYEIDFHEAALSGNWDRLEELATAAGTGVPELANRMHPVGGTAMYAAAAGGAGTSIWRVYAQGGEPDRMPEGQTETVLQKALQFADLETAEMTAFTLLSNSADPNRRSQHGESPLHIAVRRGSLAMVELLIRQGADVDATNADGWTSLELAKKGEHPAVTKMLENHQSIPRTWRSTGEATDVEGNPYRAPQWETIPLTKRLEFVGAAHANLQQLKAWSREEPRLVHSVSTTGEKAVEAGAHMGNRTIVQFLLDRGAPCSLPTAVMLGDMELVKKMLQQDPGRIHERGAHDFALLYYPVLGMAPIEMMQMLLDAGCDVEQQHQLGTTALHFASRGRDPDLVNLLIDQGADVNRVGRKFRGRRLKPLQLARDPKIIDLLKSRGATM